MSHQDTADYVLSLIVEMFTEDKQSAEHFHNAPGAGEGDAYADLFRILAKPHWFAQEKALFCLARLVDQRLVKDLGLSAVAAACGGDAVPSATAAPMGVAAQTIVQLVQWCCAQLRSPSHPTRAVPSVVSALAALLGVRDVRPLVTHSGGVDLIAPLLYATSVSGSTLSSNSQGRGDTHADNIITHTTSNGAPKHDVQLLYQVSLCCWLLTFHPPALAAMRRGSFIQGLMDVAKRATKEKVARVAILALRNIAEGTSGVGGREASGNEASNSSALVQPHALRGEDEQSLLKTISNLQQRGFEDEELVNALGDLESGSKDRSRDASSWDSYKSELSSGAMTWSAAHTDESFWRENAAKLTDNNCALLRVLITILGTEGGSTDSTSGSAAASDQSAKTLSVACHDLGEFATHYPAGRFLVTDLGGKEKTMKLLTHNDPDVRKHALLCTQKLLVANWQFIERKEGK